MPAADAPSPGDAPLPADTPPPGNAPLPADAPSSHDATSTDSGGGARGGVPRPPTSADDSHDPPLGDRFMAVGRRLRRGYMAALEPLDITPHQARALRVVVARGPLRLGALAEELRVAPRSVTDVVDWLVQRELVARTADPSDRRAIAVEATAEGRDLAARVESLRREHADDFFGHLGATDKAELSRLLNLLTPP